MFIITLILKLYLAIFDQGINETTNYGDKLMKFFYGFEKFFYLPTIFFFFYYSDNQITKKNFYFFLVINLCFVILFALLKNSRTEIFEYLVIISVLFLILFLYKKIVLTFNKFLIISFFIFLSLIFINNISNKILETRLVRDNVSSLQLLQFYNNSNGIHNNFTENFDPYAIDYTNVSLLNRFTPIAYFDKMLFDLNYFSRTDIRDYQEFLFKKIFAIFPQNFINIFNKNYKKEKFAIANGSYVERVSYNRFGGDFNKGSFIAELLISTQSYFLTFTIIYFLFLSLFYVCIKFQTFKKNELFISPLILFLSFNYIYISQADASFSFMILIFRTPIETIILYYIIQKLMLKYKKS